jgi:hypothetical protein
MVVVVSAAPAAACALGRRADGLLHYVLPTAAAGAAVAAPVLRTQRVSGASA